MVSHNRPISVTVIVNLNFKNFIANIVVNYHIIKC